MIIREHYIKQVRDFYNSDLIKIITGIRRCGKSVILEQIMNELNTVNDNIIYLNFEDKLTTENIKNSSELIKYIQTIVVCYIVNYLIFLQYYNYHQVVLLPNLYQLS